MKRTATRRTRIGLGVALLLSIGLGGARLVAEARREAPLARVEEATSNAARAAQRPERYSAQTSIEPAAADPDLEPGFPVRALYTWGSFHHGPAIQTLVGNIDDDPQLEILASGFANGPLYAWKYNGASVSGWPSPMYGAAYPSLGRLSSTAQGLQVIAGHLSFPPAALAAWLGDGTMMPGWPRSTANYVGTAPALADVDGDGLDEIFVDEGDSRLHAYRADGSVLPGWPTAPYLDGQIQVTPAMADLDGDGALEIVAVGPSVAGDLLAYHSDGTMVAGFPVSFLAYAETYPVIGDVDGDGALEIVVVARGNPEPSVKVYSAGGVLERTIPLSGGFTDALGTVPALADLDGDGFPEIVIQTDTYLNVVKGDGTALSGWPVSLGAKLLGASGPVVGDVDGDGMPDVVITTQPSICCGSDVRVYDRHGSMHPRFPKVLPIDAGAVPAIADIDLDGRNEIVVSGSGWGGGFEANKVWVYDLGGPPHGPVLWGQYMGGPRHQGRYEPPSTTSRLYIDNVTLAEGQPGLSSANFTVTLLPASTQTVTVHYATADGSAQSVDDYQATSGTLTFSPGETKKVVTVPVVGDTICEAAETFFVNLADASGGALIDDDQGRATVANDDPCDLDPPETTITSGPNLSGAGTGPISPARLQVDTAPGGSLDPAQSQVRGSGGAAGRSPFRRDRILVKPRPSVGATAMSGLHREMRATRRKRFPLLGGLEVVDVAPDLSVEDAISRYQSSGLVEYAEPDYVVSISSGATTTAAAATAMPNDPLFLNGSLWGLHNTGQNGGTNDADIDGPEGWAAKTDASSVLVAVLDTGIRYTHEDLASNMWTNPGEIPGNGIDDDGDGYIDDVHGMNAITGSGNPMDDNGHGTHVAGTIGARGNNGIGVTGVAWRATMLACKFLDSTGSGSTSDAIECINYARSKGARVLNNSWGGGGYSQALADAIAALRASGGIFVAAAGNGGGDGVGDNNDTTSFYPASYALDNVVSVASLTRTDAVSGFSNYGATSVDLGAPGAEILSTYNTSDSAYVTLSGTSMATPHVVGSLALLWARFPGDTYLNVIQRLYSATDPIPSLAGRCVTGGRLNLARAISTNLAIASFTWTGLDAITPTTNLQYAYRLDPVEPAFSAFGSATSRAFTSLSPGAYAFYVKSRDEEANEDPTPAIQTFTVGEPATLSIGDVTVTEGNTGTVNAVFTVTLSAPTLGTVTVDYATANGTATAGSDYVATNGTLTFAPGDPPKTITVTVNSDGTAEANETFFVNLTNPTGDISISDAQGLGTILNDDGLGLTCPTTVTPGASFTTTVTGGTSALDWVAMYPAGQSANSPWLTYQYVPLPRPATRTFAAPSTPGTYALRLFANDTYTLLGSCQFPVATGPTLTISDATVTEGNTGTASASFTVTLSPAASVPVTVQYATGNGTATAGSDYVAIPPTTLTFAPGEPPKTITVVVNGDTTPEPNETFFVNLTNATGGATIGDAQGQGTITNDDGSLAPLTCPSSAAPGASFAATVTGGASAMDWVALYPAGQAAASPWLAYQYVPLPRPATRTFTAPATPGTYELRLFANESYTLLGSCQFPVATGPTLTISDATVTEGNTGTANASFTVTLSPTAVGTVTVDYATANGTATAGSDYVAIPPTTLTFAPGDPPQTITVVVNGDTTPEPNETFFVNLTNATGGAMIGDAQGQGTITNDDGSPSLLTCPLAEVPPGSSVTTTVTGGASAMDWVAMYPAGQSANSPWLAYQYVPLPRPATRTFTAPSTPGTYALRLFANDTYTLLGSCQFPVGGSPSFTISDVTVTEGNVGTVNATFTVSLSPAIGGTATVQYATANGTATAGSDYVATSGTLTFAPGDTSKTITVVVNGDTTLEPNETFFVNLTSATGAPTISDAQGQGTITNDDGTVGPLTCPTMAAPGASFTATVTGGTSAMDWLALYALGVPNSPAPANWRYVPLPRPSTQSFTAPTTPGTYELRLFANDSYTLLGSCQFPVAIGPSLTISDVMVTEGNAGTVNADFTVALSPAALVPVTVDYATANGTATAGSDYVATSGTLTFAPGDPPKTITVLVNGDTTGEPNETFFVNLTNPTGGSVIGDGQGQGTIISDEPPPTALTCPTTVAPGASFTISVLAGSSALDWVAMYPAGQTANSPWLAYQYVPLPRPATRTFMAPSTTGIYELRLFVNDSYALLASCQFPVATGPSLTISDVTLTEGNAGSASANFSVSLAPAAAGTVTVQYVTANGTATAGDDYVAKTGTLTFAPGDPPKTISVLVNADTANEPDETFFVNLSNVTGPATIGDGQGQATIINDDPPPGALSCPTIVAPGESFATTVTGGASSLDWVAMYPAGQAAHSPWLSYQYVPMPRPQTRTFTAPAAPGSYELRLFANDGFTPIGSCSFPVVPSPVTLIAPADAAILDNGCVPPTSEHIIWDFFWSPVADATAYHLYVWHTGSINPVINNATLTATTYHHDSNGYIAQPNRFGWRWKVRALVNGAWSSFSAERSFDVELPNTDCPTGGGTP